MFKICKKYWLLCLFIAITVLGVLIYGFLGEDSLSWKYWGALDSSSAVALGILAFFAYKDLAKEQDIIRLYFNVKDKKKVDTGLSVLRKDCTRSEIIGILGMMQTITEKRFNYNTIHLKELLQEVNRVQRGKQKEFYIPVTKEEFEQFDLTKKANIGEQVSKKEQFTK